MNRKQLENLVWRYASVKKTFAETLTERVTELLPARSKSHGNRYLGISHADLVDGSDLSRAVKLSQVPETELAGMLPEFLYPGMRRAKLKGTRKQRRAHLQTRD